MRIIHDWPEHKRLQFAQLLINYVDSCTALTNRSDRRLRFAPGCPCYSAHHPGR